MPPDLPLFGLFLSAVVLAVTTGPGVLYVLTRSLRGGLAEGLSSSFGTASGR
jgi:threonine/homoserine/homoserine lactone efflux protein